MQRTIIKRISALIATAAMAVSILPSLPAGATDITKSEHMGHVGLTFMGTGDKPDFTGTASVDTSSWVARDTGNGTEGTKFWVGYYVSDLATMDYDGSHIYSSSDTNSGLFRTATGINYPSKFVEALNMNTSNTAFFTAMSADPMWTETHTGGMMSLQYTMLYQVSAAEVQDLPGSEVPQEDTNIPSKYTPKVAYHSLATTNWAMFGRRFQGAVDNRKYYFQYVQFELIEKPGTNDDLLLSVARNPQQMDFEFGENGTKWTGTWNNSVETTDTTNRDATLIYHLLYDGDLTIYSSGATDDYDELKKSGTLTKSLDDYIAGQTFNPAGLTFTPHKVVSEELTPITPVADNYKDIKFYVAEAGITTSANLLAGLEADPATTRELAKDTELAASDNGKTVYAAYKIGNVTQIVAVGAITVAAQSVSSIAIKAAKTTFGNGTYYDTTKIKDVLTAATDPERLVVTITYNNGKTKDVSYVAYTEGTGSSAVTYTAFDPDPEKDEAEDIVLYKADASGNYSIVGDNDYFVGNQSNSNKQTFYAVLKSKVSNNDVGAVNSDFKADVEVTVTADTTTITAKGKADNGKSYNGDDYKLTYGVGYPITLDNLTLTTKDASKSSANAAQTVTELGNNIIYFYNDDNSGTYANGTSHVITPGTDKYAAAMNDKKLYAVPANNTTATPTEIGTLKTREIAAATTGNSFSAAETTGLTYGDTLDKVFYKAATTDPAAAAVNATVTVNYNNGDEETFTWDDSAKNFVKAVDTSAGTPALTLLGDGTNNEGVTLTYNGADVAAANIAATILQPSASADNKKVGFTVGSTPTTILESEALVVGKATAHINITKNDTNPAFTKPYDGNTDLPENANYGTLAIADTLSADSALIAKVDPAGLSFAYNTASAGDDKKVVVTGTPAIDAKETNGADANELAELNKKYTFELGTGFSKDGNDTIITGEVAKISKAKLTVTALPKLTDNYAIEVGESDNSKLSGVYENYVLKNNSAQDTNSNIVKGDDVKLTFKYDYSSLTAQQKGQAGEYTITGTYSGTEGSKTLGLSGTASDNYELDTNNMPDLKGTVANKKLEKVIVVSTSDMKKIYTYPDLKLNLSDWKVQLKYEGSEAQPAISVEAFLKDKGVLTFKDKSGANITVNSANVDNVLSNPTTAYNIAYGDTPLTFTWDGNNDPEKQGTSTVTGKKKAIRVDKLNYAPSKKYNSNQTEFNMDIDGEGDDEIGVKYNAAFDDDNANEQIKVTISGVELTGDDAENYELVVDDEGTVYDKTSETPAVVLEDAGTIEPADQTVAPEITKATASVSTADNSVTVTAPTGKTTNPDSAYEYAIVKKGSAAPDDDAYQSTPTFSGLDRDTEYTVYARIAATEDGNYAPSEPVTSDDVKTYKYHVSVFKKNADPATAAPVKAAYTSVETVASDAEMHTALSGKPTRWKAYFTDAACTEKIEYEYKFDDNDTNGDVVLYMTQSSGGGGGGGSSSGGTTTYTVKFVSQNDGSITDGKTSVSVESGKYVTEVPAITPNEGYTFLGWSADGETTVDPTTVKILKATTFTALYASADATPAPTTAPAPTDKPVINTDYDKPYASGYEDDSFRPNNNITRAELAAMIARLSYGDDLPDGVYSASFSDIADDAWYNKYVGYLEDKNVLSGYEDGTFRPENPVTRGEIAAVITRAQRFSIASYNGMFADVTDYDWAKDYIMTLAQQGIASGYEDGSFGPYAPVTRAEAVTMINKVLDDQEPVISIVPNDISGHWAENEILLAVNYRNKKDAELVVTDEPQTTDEPQITEEPAADETTTDETTTDETTTDETSADKTTTDENAETTTDTTTETTGEADAQ